MSINGLNPLSYIGVDSPNPAAQIVTMNQDPTVNDSLNFTIGDVWINQNALVPNTESVFILTSLSGGTATWTEIGSQGNVLDVIGGTNITVNTVAGTATVNLNPSIVLAGSVTAGTGVTATTGNLTATAGNLIVSNGNAFITGGIIELTDNSNNAAGSSLSIFKNRNGGTVQTGDALGTVEFFGDDGNAFQRSAYMRTNVVGTVAAGRVPSKITFATTPDAVSTPQERVIIDENGTVNINAPTAPAIALNVDGDIVISGITISTARIQAETLTTTGDLGGVVSATTFTDVDVANVPGGGALTIDSQSANPGTQAGFIKIYVGATVAYIPYFTNIAP